MTPIASLYQQAKTRPNAIAPIHGENIWSYQRLADAVERLARGLVGRGIRKGDRIVLHMPNRAELAVSLFAYFHIGAMAVPLNTPLKAAEIKPLLQRSQPALYFGHADSTMRCERSMPRSCCRTGVLSLTISARDITRNRGTRSCAIPVRSRLFRIWLGGPADNAAAGIWFV